MKNKSLRKRSENLLEAANTVEEYYQLGCEISELGRLIRHMAAHMSELQRKVDSQAEVLRNYQKEKRNGEKK